MNKTGRGLTMLKKLQIGRRGVTMGLAVAVAGLGLMSAISSVQAKEVTARLSFHWGPKHPAAIQAIEFAKRVNERGAGKIKIDVFPAGQLFGIREIMGAIAAGSVEMGGTVGIVSFPRIDKNYNVTAIPGYFTSFEDQRDFFENTTAGKKVWNNIMTKAGITVVAYDPVGPIATFSVRDNLSTVSSMAGVKARVLVKADRVRWKALNAGKMVSIPTREVYNGLQSGMVDTVSTVPGAIKAYSWWEYLKSGQMPYVTFADAYLMANAAWFNGLPADVKKIMREVGAQISKEATATIMAASDEIMGEFAKRGANLTTLAGAELGKMKKLEADVMAPDYAKMVDADVFAALQRHAKQ
jgi:TRAP-type C4-dicarboxylate transport system substrate-binding protein